MRKWEWAPARSMAAAVGCTLASGLTKRHLRFPVHREHGRVEAHVVVEPTLGGHLMAGAPLLVLHFSIWRSSTSACTLISSTLTRSVEASGPALMMARIVSRSTRTVRGAQYRR